MGAKKYLVDAKPFLPDGTDQFSQDDLIDIYDRGQNKWLQIPVSLLTPQLKADLYATKNVGGITVGQTLAAGTKLEQLFQQMLTVEEPPVYLQPSIQLNCNFSNNQKVEAGTELFINYVVNYYQNDGGEPVICRFYKDGLEVATDDTELFAVTSILHSLTDEDVFLKAEVDYDGGLIKNTNLGNPYPDGQIQTGTIVSNTVKIDAVRRLFYGVSQPVTSSAEIRALPHSIYGPANGTQFTIFIPPNVTSVTFAYPASLPAVESR